jgi:hypothetical protein
LPADRTEAIPVRTGIQTRPTVIFPASDGSGAAVLTDGSGADEPSFGLLCNLDRKRIQGNVESKDKLRREERLFCSHYVAETYNSIGKDLKKGVSDRFMSPGDIAASPLLKRLGVLRKTLKQPAVAGR